MTGLIAVVVVLLVATAFGLWRRRTNGRFVETTASADSTASSSPRRLTADELGGALGSRATLVEFTSAFCAPCRATRRVLDRVVASVAGVTVIEVDAETELALTRELGILRTPTVLILDAHGSIHHRATGEPRYADVVAALGAAIPDGSDSRT
ncbi:MAG: thioredoxin family protein [Actinobacteria bacterium]|nr:thioredoxin family protein [Actinomycetota bacterium]